MCSGALAFGSTSPGSLFHSKNVSVELPNFSNLSIVRVRLIGQPTNYGDEQSHREREDHVERDFGVAAHFADTPLIFSNVRRVPMPNIPNISSQSMLSSAGAGGMTCPNIPATHIPTGATTN